MLRRLRGILGEDSVPELTPGEAHGRVVAGEAVLVDVREEAEWEAGRIPGSIHVPLGELRSRRSTGVPESEEIVLVCRSGTRSAIAATMLSSDGREATNLKGGVKAWIREGLPFEGSVG